MPLPRVIIHYGKCIEEGTIERLLKMQFATRILNQCTIDSWFRFSACPLFKIIYYSNRERVAYFKVSESTRLFLVVPELRDNATGLRGIK